MKFLTSKTAVKKTLRIARENLEFGWTRYTSARNYYRKPVSPTGPSAERFDLRGAIENAASVVTNNEDRQLDLLVDAESILRKVTKTDFLDDFNDSQTSVDPILEVLTKAIKKVR